VALCFLTAILSGLAPARAAFRTNVVDALKEGGGSRGGARHRNIVFRRIVVAQVALALLITNGALMLFASYRKLLQTDLIFDTERVLTLELWLTGPRYEEGKQRVRFWEQLRDSVAQIPGVEQAEVTTKLPLEGGRNGEILTDDQVFTPNTPRPLAEWSYVSPGYFDAMGIPLLAGRTLRKEDFNPKEIGVVVNTALAERCWPGGNPLGKRIRLNSAQLYWHSTVVGVVASARQWGAERQSLPEIYFPYEVEPRTKSFLIVRSPSDPLQFVSAIRKEISRIDSDLAPTRIRTMAAVFSTVTRHRKFLTLLLDLFAGIALVLAVSGIYGTISHQVAQRTHEFGVRIALGATKGRVLGTVFRETLFMLLLGGGIGLIATIEATYLFRSQLYGISPLHPLYLAGGIFLVGIAALLAALVPALRAAQTNPVQALRAE
jgi:predicted permease